MTRRMPKLYAGIYRTRESFGGDEVALLLYEGLASLFHSQEAEPEALRPPRVDRLRAATEHRQSYGLPRPE